MTETTEKAETKTMTTAEVVEYLRERNFRTQRGTFASPEWVRLRVHKNMFPARAEGGGWHKKDIDAWLAARDAVEGHLLTTQQVAQAIKKMGCPRMIHSRSSIIRRLREVACPVEDGGRLLWPLSAPEFYVRRFGYLHER